MPTVRGRCMDISNARRWTPRSICCETERRKKFETKRRKDQQSDLRQTATQKKTEETKLDLVNQQNQCLLFVVSD
jgi:hypothetical protein